MARPTKLTPETQERFLEGLRMGLTMELSSNFAGVDVRTVYGWIQRGKREGDGIFFQFSQALKKAEGECAAVCMRRIQEAADKGQWTASAWIMERRFKGYTQRRTDEDARDERTEEIDVSTPEGRQQAIDILNTIPIDILREINQQRLIAAIQGEADEPDN